MMCSSCVDSLPPFSFHNRVIFFSAARNHRHHSIIPGSNFWQAVSSVFHHFIHSISMNASCGNRHFFRVLRDRRVVHCSNGTLFASDSSGSTFHVGLMAVSI